MESWNGQQQKRIESSPNAKYTINVQYTIYANRPKKALKGKNCTRPR